MNIHIEYTLSRRGVTSIHSPSWARHIQYTTHTQFPFFFSICFGDALSYYAIAATISLTACGKLKNAQRLYKIKSNVSLVVVCAMHARAFACLLVVWQSEKVFDKKIAGYIQCNFSFQNIAFYIPHGSALLRST